jgi:hypothetical protein
MTKVTKPRSAMPALTESQKKRAKRNEQIQFDYETQIKINGSSRMGVAQYVAKRHKVSVATVLRCVG